LTIRVEGMRKEMGLWGVPMGYRRHVRWARIGGSNVNSEQVFLSVQIELQSIFRDIGEFDPGAGRTLAARLTHASRTGSCLRVWSSGERVRNT
jgi:hypothetical protein